MCMSSYNCIMRIVLRHGVRLLLWDSAGLGGQCASCSVVGQHLVWRLNDLSPYLPVSTFNLCELVLSLAMALAISCLQLAMS